MRLMSKAILTISAAGLVGLAQAQDVRNEGSGTRRAALDRMVFQPAPIDVILGASEWSGDKPSAAELSGKPVLVFTFSEWYRPSHAAAMLAKRLQAQHSDLVVIGVHDDEGWDEAVAFAEKRKLGFPIVRDTDSLIRTAFMVDQDPDAYVIDRTGNLRYADIATDSIARAVGIVAAEDSSLAANAQSNLASMRAQARADARRSGSINQDISLENLPKIPFTAPSDEVYAATNWPKIDKELLEKASSIAELTPPFAVPDGEWLNGKPDTEGKIIVAYIWHPSDRSVVKTLMPRMENMHKQRSRDVAVMGFMIPATDDRSRSRNQGGLIVDEFMDIPISLEGMKGAIGDLRLTQPLLATPGSPLPVVGETRGRRNNTDIFGRIVIVSTDGRVRRSAMWRDWGEVQQAIDHLLREDPGIKARQRAEARYIRGNGG